MNTFEERLDELAQTANRADLHYTIWWIYRHEGPTYKKVMNEFLGFFRASLGAHFVAMVLELYKLLDSRTDSVSLKSLLEEAGKFSELDAETIDTLKEKVATLGPMREKVALLRHKLFAHRDRELSYDSVLASAAVKPDDFRDLIDRAFDILNEVFVVRRMGTWPRDHRTGRDTHRLLDTLVGLRGADSPNPAPAPGG
jgi:DNA-directed RNA polymerase subunit F